MLSLFLFHVKTVQVESRLQGDTGPASQPRALGLGKSLSPWLSP